jgi:hypothetical protein
VHQETQGEKDPFRIALARIYSSIKITLSHYMVLCIPFGPYCKGFGHMRRLDFLAPR